MSDILTLARAVAEELKEYKAELLYFPEFELRDLDDLRIVVVPAGTQYKTLSRAAHEELPKVQIGILKRCREDATFPRGTRGTAESADRHIETMPGGCAG